MIELLMVIAIIAIPPSLLLPALGKVKAKGQSIACLNNLMQLQLAFCDGHAEHRRWKWPKAQETPRTPPENNVDLQDVRWMQERLPGP